MNELDLNDIVSVELTEWGATYLNAEAIFKDLTNPSDYPHKKDYKKGDIYEAQLWHIMLEFHDGLRYDKERAFLKMKLVKRIKTYE